MSFATIRSKLRSLVQENAKAGKDIFTFDTSRIFTLGEENVVTVTDLLKNDVSVSQSGGTWSYSSSTNKVTISSLFSMTAGDTIQINYTHYPNYSDTELTGYISAAISWIAVCNYKTFQLDSDDINPEPTEAEENLIALVASMIIKPDNKSYHLQELRVLVPNTSVSLDEKIRRVIASFKRNTHGIFSVIITK